MNIDIYEEAGREKGVNCIHIIIFTDNHYLNRF